jgi:eukaryotic-like serine/threonine-protein kinase
VRHLRPGCATGPYGAPEIWLGEPENASPLPADIYAFGCVAFEVLTGRTLFAASDETAQISMHIAHDGFPPLMKKLVERPATAALGEILYSTLRRDPSIRPTVRQVREQLSVLARELSRRSWPLS